MIDDLVISGDRRILLIVIDGLGGLPIDGSTPLEKARTPTLDSITPQASLGLLDPVGPGITPGSGPGHLALFGYDPLKFKIGRGLLEALGVGFDVGPDDLCLRGNFATRKGNIVTDRRAGRIATEVNTRLCGRLSQIKEINGIKVTIRPGKEHRFVVVFNGPGLNDNISDADPQKSGKEMIMARPLADGAGSSTRVINEFIRRADEILIDEDRANHVLLRGAASYPALQTIEERFKMKGLALATYPMYLGIARLLGMETINPGPGIQTLFEAYLTKKDDYDFFYLHIKETDKAGEDGNFEEKTRVVEEIDSHLKSLLDVLPDVLAITADHSTPAKLKAHSWHPCPLFIKSDYTIADQIPRFTERNCVKGSIGRIQGVELMPILLANSLRLKKYGA